MNTRLLRAGILSAIVFGNTITFGLIANQTVPAMANGSSGMGDCDSGYEHKDENSPFTYTSTNIINRIYIKAGSQVQGDACFLFTADATTDCYRVTGLGTNTVTATNFGDSDDCKDISHVEFYTGGSTVTPTPTATTTPTSTPQATATPTPTSASTPTPTPTPDPEATPTNTPVPTSPPNIGGPGDGLSDGRSDGRSSCPECTAAPQGEVLGASTLAATGNASDTMFLVGLLSLIASIPAYAASKRFV